MTGLLKARWLIFRWTAAAVVCLVVFAACWLCIAQRAAGQRSPQITCCQRKAKIAALKHLRSRLT